MNRQQVIELLRQGGRIEQIERGTATDSYGHYEINGEAVEDVETEVLLRDMFMNRELQRQQIERVEYVERYVYTLRDAGEGGA